MQSSLARQLTRQAASVHTSVILRQLAAAPTAAGIFLVIHSHGQDDPRRHLASALPRDWATDSVAGTTIKPLTRRPEQQQQQQQQPGRLRPLDAASHEPKQALEAVERGHVAPVVEGFEGHAGQRESKVIRQKVCGRVYETILHGLPSGSVSKEARATDDTTLAAELVTRNASLVTSLSDQLKATFLPTGYPKTVAPNYLSYVSWRALQQLSSSANGVLASSFLLYAVGLGQGAIPVAGAVNWILKDGIGQAGTLLCARFMAKSFDDNARGWYVRGAILLNMASMVEIATVFLPEHFLIMGSFANALKGLTWMSLGATSAAFNLAFQRKNNIADIHARTTTQSITVSLLGTGAGAWMASVVGQSATEALAVSTALSVVNVFSAYRTTKCVPLQTLNPVRCRILAGKFAEQTADGSHWVPNGSSCLLPDPASVALLDPVGFFPQQLSGFFQQLTDPQGKSKPPRIGTPLHMASELPADVLRVVVRLHSRCQFMVFPMGQDMHVILRDTAKDYDFVEAFLHAEMLLREISARKAQQGDHNNDLELPAAELQDAVVASLQRTASLGPLFRHELQRAGWCTQRLVIEGNLNRAAW